jgi:hypothetical protein
MAHRKVGRWWTALLALCLTIAFLGTVLHTHAQHPTTTGASKCVVCAAHQEHAAPASPVASAVVLESCPCNAEETTLAAPTGAVARVSSRSPPSAS